MMAIGLPGILKRGKKAEKIKEIDRQLEELAAESKASGGQGPAAGAEPASGPFTAVARAVGKLFNPVKEDSKMIDEQLSMVIAESEEMAAEDLKPPAAGPPDVPAGGADEVDMTGGLAEPAGDGMDGEQENKLRVDEVKADTAKSGQSIKDNGPKGEAPKAGGPAAAAPAGAIDFRDDLLSKLAETAKAEKNVTMDIMRDMKGRRVDCNELRGELLEISMLLKRPAGGKRRKSGG